MLAEGRRGLGRGGLVRISEEGVRIGRRGSRVKSWRIKGRIKVQPKGFVETLHGSELLMSALRSAFRRHLSLRG